MSSVLWAFVIPMLTDGQQSTVIATLVSASAAIGVAILTQRSSSRNTQLTTRTDIEKEALQRAEQFYENLIDRQDKVLARQQGEIDGLETEVSDLKAKMRALELEKARELAALKAHRDRLMDELEAAKKLLAIKYPDE